MADDLQNYKLQLQQVSNSISCLLFDMLKVNVWKRLKINLTSMQYKHRK